jgi:hypothetical protein
MPNAAGIIYESIWRDPDFRRLSRTAQTMYAQLLSQKELDCAGVLPLQPDKWAMGCEELTVEQVWADLNELQAGRFVFYDLDTWEALVRTHMRNSNVLKVPNMRKSAQRAARLVGSASLRSVLAVELVATGDPDLASTGRDLAPNSVRVAEPFANPSGTLPEPTGVGKGMGVTHLSRDKGGEARPQCSKHPQGNPNDEPCGGCRRVREWDQAHDASRAADDLQAKRLARERAESCPTCHGTNWVPDTDPAIKCNHNNQGATTA